MTERRVRHLLREQALEELESGRITQQQYADRVQALENLDLLELRKLGEWVQTQLAAEQIAGMLVGALLPMCGNDVAAVRRFIRDQKAEARRAFRRSQGQQ